MAVQGARISLDTLIESTHILYGISVFIPRIMFQASSVGKLKSKSFETRESR